MGSHSGPQGSDSGFPHWGDPTLDSNDKPIGVGGLFAISIVG
jgi:hypothetical protein